MKYAIKIVPKSDRNAKGEWMNCPDDIEVPDFGSLWTEAQEFFEQFVPNDFFLVAYRRYDATKIPVDVVIE